MTFQVLLSCMHQKDASIILHSNINCDCLVANQCDENHEEITNQQPYHKIIYTTSRGLSKSRNLCIKQAWADICLISDDDEIFVDDLEQIITNIYKKHPEADIIAFQLENASGFGENIANDKKKYSKKGFKCGLLQSLHISSWQISFRRESILRKNIKFDEMMGSGTGNGAQEESKFLSDCLRAGLVIWYEPISIGRMEDRHPSQWFKGFDKKFFYNRGWSTRRFLGLFLSILYAAYFAIKKYPIYKKEVSMTVALFYMFKGIFSPKERPCKSK